MEWEMEGGGRGRRNKKYILVMENQRVYKILLTIHYLFMMSMRRVWRGC